MKSVQPKLVTHTTCIKPEILKKHYMLWNPWYSWHSRDDYTNNIYSIRNAYYSSLDGNINANSLSTVIAGVNSSLDTR